MSPRDALPAVVAVLTGCGRIAFTAVDADAATDGGDAALDAPAFTPIELVVDDFERTVASGWNVAPIGGMWNIYNPDGAAYSVSGGVGRVRSFAMGTYTDVFAAPVARDVEVRGTFSISEAPTSGEFHVRLSARVVANGTGYNARVFYGPGGIAEVAMFRSISPGQVALARTPSFFTGLSPGEPLGVSLRVVGAMPAVLCARFWRIADGEPSACTFTAMDSSVELVGTGTSFFVTHFIGDPAPTDVTLDDFRYLQVGPQ